jgi:hypothetical protein
MLQKLCRYALSMDAGSHEEVPPVSQDTDKLGGQRFIQNLDGCFPVGGVAFSDCAILNVAAGALAQCFDVGKKRFIRHGLDSWLICHGIHSST